MFANFQYVSRFTRQCIDTLFVSLTKMDDGTNEKNNWHANPASENLKNLQFTYMFSEFLKGKNLEQEVVLLKLVTTIRCYEDQEQNDTSKQDFINSLNELKQDTNLTDCEVKQVVEDLLEAVKDPSTELDNSFDKLVAKVNEKGHINDFFLMQQAHLDKSTKQKGKKGK